jgi:hypothetical protein
MGPDATTRQVFGVMSVRRAELSAAVELVLDVG